MKENRKIISFVTLIVCLLMFFTSCVSNNDETDLWKDALYTQDTIVGDGEKTLYIEVKTPKKSITLTILTDKETVGEALSEHNLIDGENGAYGLYVKKVNNILADYDINQTYWSFTKDGEYLSSGVDITKFSSNDKFELVYTK